MTQEIEQRTDDWFSIRCGKVTASKLAAVMAKLRDGKPGADRKNYMAQLVAERLTGNVEQSYMNAAMQWGVDQEASAREAYEFERGVTVAEIGFVIHPDIPNAGASPDGLVGDDGLVEIKCPNTATHIETLRGGNIDGRYIKQMQWQMACTGRQWCDFASYDPRLPVEMQLYVQRVDRDDDMIAEMEAEVRAFLTELDETVADLSTRYSMKEAA
ncbi:lambda exonuclease family protein [Novosphingopyxis sp. YJ-S2-01]|uniref:lambda exonuclease family protein n=1 Tax=Novosphingopyxis sp. YJ-S2-01 TaxID=2794021 RepID=UPI0018DD8013|nr:lambda exonuclease family protein [Novosphingopyxis sp. YJ-S2-01]MBH9537491.1 YqaJ viral recombinase family protein [Novosphingopyxis sp. YJ-S2-01]